MTPAESVKSDLNISGGYTLTSKLIWIDLEMTGLDPEKQVIIEIATMITDNQLCILDEGPNIAVNYPEEALFEMEEWSRSHHQASGLLDRVHRSSHDLQMAEEETLEFLSRHCKEGESPVCGNSVWQDRRFLIRHMPRLESFFHYRMIDVSSFKEVITRWYPSVPAYQKEKAHLALMDIKESINELKYYRQMMFSQNSQTSE